MLEGMEKQMILRVLSETGGHYQKAAERLGISRRTLSRKMKIYERDLALTNRRQPQDCI
jgi:transcriptional regulator with PAS, ATPase and Fis domain